ncbi:MAG: hypothetical protein ACLRIS_17485 [Flavonifractor plautii]
MVVYHHLENGMDEKLEYATPEEAEQAARGYLDGTMEADGFAYEAQLSAICWKRNGSAQSGTSPRWNYLPQKKELNRNRRQRLCPHKKAQRRQRSICSIRSVLLSFNPPAANFITIMATMCRVGFPM